ncbi:chitosanase [Microbacterium aurantiacum]|uniref:chitosanase n=1 Tax=Microbacterium aurantiacum TaxID=162393 RepID=UPI001CA4AABF|nr:chitosanase [Microbacterium aurantiacum]
MRHRRPLLALLAAAIAIPLAGVVASTAQAAPITLRDPIKREVAMAVMISAENSDIEWWTKYGYIEPINDHRGYTAGIVGFTSGTGDMLELVKYYTSKVPGNNLAKWIDELEDVNGTDDIGPLGSAYVADWEAEAQQPRWQQAQRDMVNRMYFDVSVDQAIADGLGPLGQFIYFDAYVMHGDGGDTGFDAMRTRTRAKAKTPASGGTEAAYLKAFLDERRTTMKNAPEDVDGAWEDTSRIDTAQRVFLNNGNFNLNTPLTWAVYGESFSLPATVTPHWPADIPYTDPGTPTTGTLISKNRPATASTVEAAGHEAAKAVDGDASTRWASTEGVDNQWVRVDLGAGAKIDKVVLKWEAAYASKYRIETSNDGTTWTVLKTEAAGNGGTDEHAALNGTGRYLRIFGTARGTAYGYSLFEVEAYGTAGGTTPTPTPTPTPTQTPNPADVLISKSKTTTTSSVEAAGHEGAKAVDGDATTRWASIEGVDPQWISVDLGTGAKVNKVVLKWEAAYAKNYTIDISNDGTTWSTLKTESAGNGGTDEHLNLNGTGRYLRIKGTARGTAWGYSLYEFEAYGVAGTGGGNPNPGTSFTVVAAGDIAGPDCTTRGVPTDNGDMQSDCKHFETFDRAKAINPAFYITLGDMQYDDGHMEDFMAAYDKTWGTVKNNTWPVPGNHETYDDYDNLDPKAYRAYFGNRATPQGKMYYSYDYGNWHFIALDSNNVDDQAQRDWLAADLASNTKQCVAAYMHHPGFSSGSHGNEPVAQPFWKMLANANVEIVLSGHDHDYERFAAMNASGAASSAGTVQIVSGLGGHEMRDFSNTKPNSVKRINTAYGVSQLDFTDTTVTHKFVDIGGTVLDSNTITCH